MFVYFFLCFASMMNSHGINTSLAVINEIVHILFFIHTEGMSLSQIVIMALKQTVI